MSQPAADIALPSRLPVRLPVRMLDEGLLVLSAFFVEHIHLVADLGGPLDPTRLARAARLAMDAEPILGCRFVRRWLRPYWEQLPRERLEAFAVATAPGEERETATERFLGAPLDAEEGPQLALLHLPGAAGDRLVLKAQHRAMDAGGTKDLAARLAEAYRALGRDPGWRPTPSRGSRSLWQVYRRVLPWRLPAIVARHLRDAWRSAVPWQSLHLPTGAVGEGPPYFRVRHVEGARLAALDALRRSLGATRNDLLFAAALRALVRLGGWNGRDALRLVGTVDLRRYLPDGRADGLCNLSGFLFPDLGRTLGADLAETTCRMKAELDGAKGRLPGLGFNLFARLTTGAWPSGLVTRVIPAVIGWQNRTGNRPPVLTNMGAIEPARLDFGPEVGPPRRAWMVVPACRPGAFGAGISGDGDRLTLSLGAFEPALPRATADAFLDLVDAELPE